MAIFVISQLKVEGGKGLGSEFGKHGVLGGQLGGVVNLFFFKLIGFKRQASRTGRPGGYLEGLPGPTVQPSFCQQSGVDR